MKRSFAVSSVVHLAFITLIIVPGYRRVHYLGSEVINVKLVGETRPATKQQVKAPPPEQEKVVAEKEPPKSKMAYESRTTTRKPETEKAQKSKTKPKTTEPESAKTAPVETSGAGTKSKVRVDDRDFRFAYYLEIVKERISSNWSPPPVTGSAEGVISTVYFRISRDGRLSDVRIEKTSEFDLFDRSALRAVSLSSPLPPLPAGFKSGWLGVHFEFEQKSG